MKREPTAFEDFADDLRRDSEAAIDAAAEKAFWEFDARRKQTGEARLAFKAAWREAFTRGEAL